MIAKRIVEAAHALARGESTSTRLVEEALERASDAAGEGGRTFIHLYPEAARIQAEASDRLRGAGIVASPLGGIPISIKDLFDVAGETTTAGSVVLRDSAPAGADAAIVRRLRAAGAVLVGKTNMTEFAYSGVGLNPHYGTPRNCWDRETGRIPGGSSSGAAVSVTDAMCVAAIGTDTGGSVRIPAALNGLVGFKPTAARVARDGAFPLSTTLDSIGPLANSVACCAIVDAVLAGEEPVVPAPIALRGLRFAVPRDYVLDDLDEAVAASFGAALSRLSAAGAQLVEVPFPELKELPSINAKGGFSAAECYARLRILIASVPEKFDPRVLTRIRPGAAMSAAEYIDLFAARASLIERAAARTAPFDAVVMPTVARIAPPISALAADADYARINLSILRNPSIVNFLDRCALTLPCHEPGAAPVGLMLMGEHLGDRRLLALGLACEAALGRQSENAA
jgi:aspartyl-tRNA(Asn)/glutamyl-tRNA(Gln) amidotransferase subunit A